jgi:ABC-type antimicrobial peptide transport system permease subunit
MWASTTLIPLAIPIELTANLKQPSGASVAHLIQGPYEERLASKALSQAAERAIQEVDRGLPVYDVRTIREKTAMASTFVVMQSTFAGIFAVIALVLAATGIYGVMAYRTELRTHEIGIRVALGASRADLMRLVLLQGMRLTAIGLALGLALSFGLTRVIAGLLYGIGANDPVTIFAVLILLAAMSLLASYLPAQRAMRVNPVTAIREL